MADASFAIDIATQFTGGDTAVATLEELADSLSAAENATSAAEQELKEATDRYAELERAAVKAWTAAERAALKGTVPERLINNLAQAKRNLDAQTDAVTRAEAAAKRAASLEKSYAEAIARRNKAAAESQKGLMRLYQVLDAGGDTFDRLGGGMGRVVGTGADAVKAVVSLARETSAMTAVGVGAAAAVVLVAAAFTAAAVAATGYAIATADAARSGRLNIAAIEASDERLKGLAGMLPGIATQTGLANDKIAELARGLAAAKVSADDLPVALAAAATAEAALTGEGAKLIASLKAQKKSVGELASDVERRYGGIVSAKILSLSAQSERLKKNFGALLDGLNIEPLLQGLTTLVSLFDKSTASGAALQLIFEKIFQPIIDGATASIPAIEAFVLGLEIQFLKLYIAVKPIISSILEMLGLDSPNFDWLAAADFSARMLVNSIAVAIGMVSALVAVCIAAPVALGKLGSAMGEIGVQMVRGLAAGITGMGSAVVDAITGVVGGAINAAKNLLGIKSPSRVFAEIGENTAMGFTGGIEAENDNARGAVEELVSPPAVSVPAAAAPRGGAGSPITIHLTIHVGAGADPKAGEAIAAEVRKALLEVLEGDALQIGSEAAA